MSLKILLFGEFPCHPVDRTLYFHYQECEFSPGWGTKVLQAAQWDQKKKSMVLHVLQVELFKSLVIVEEI